jgi:hypothetical protein
LTRKYLTRVQLVEFLREHGYPISLSSMNKWCMPCLNQGPPVAAWWGRRPLYDLQAALGCAESRLRPSRAA